MRELFLLTCLLISFELVFLFQWAADYLGGYQLIANHLSIPPKVIPDIIYFVCIQLGLHFLYAIFIGLMAKLISIAWPVIARGLEKPWIAASQRTLLAMTGIRRALTGSGGPIALWVLGLVIIFLANQHYFPNSKFSDFTSSLIPYPIGYDLLIILLTIFSTLGIIACIGLFIFSRTGTALLVSLLAIGIIFSAPSSRHSLSAESSKPNIIIIGIDSVRPDFLSFFGGETNTHYLNQFLNQSTVFSEALTPLARTFPAWVSILTGEYPKHHGVRTVLGNAKDLHFEHTLPTLLSQQGYETIFATDETRFSNIDQHFGFHRVIAPPIGFNDFLLGTVNDFPLSNLLINTRVGRYLFPYSYANRGVFTAYDPNSFLASMDDALKSIQHRPLFLAVHFCLPHFPYIWGVNQAKDKSIQNYQLALLRSDQQFHDFMKILSTNGLLNHAMVVLLSDHGEALELPGDRITDAELYASPQKPPHFYPASMDTEAFNQSGGHGTDVLSLTQYHVLLAFQLFGYAKNQVRLIPGIVSLLDIKPTILSLLNSHDNKTDGHSLAANILNPTSAVNIKNDFFIESDFSPAAVRSAHPETKDVLFEGINYFQIDPHSTRITVKKEMQFLILSSKQYADLYQHWILALYPQPHHKMTPILVNLKTGEWTNNLTLPLAQHSPAKHMLAALENFYKGDIICVENDRNALSSLLPALD